GDDAACGGGPPDSARLAAGLRIPARLRADRVRARQRPAVLDRAVRGRLTRARRIIRRGLGRMDESPPLPRHPMEPSPTRPTLGLALGGGGARGLAHVGVLRALEDEGLAVDVVAGASMGGLLGAAFAAGFPADAIERAARGDSQRARLLRFSDRHPTLQGLFSGRKIEAYVDSVIGTYSRFEDLRRPLALAATDLVSGREVVLREGRVVPAMRATMSLPGVFAPVEWDGYRLVDGGLLNNV